MSDVCQDQDVFNKAVRKALKYTEKKEKPKGWVSIVSMAIYILFMFWALVLAMKVSTPSTKTLHYVFAIVFSPIYVIAYYLGRGNMSL